MTAEFESVRRLNGPLHEWFELSYASYLTLHRTLLQSMPVEWQERMVGLLTELSESFAHLQHPHTYSVHARDSKGRFISEPFPPYRHARFSGPTESRWR